MRCRYRPGRGAAAHGGTSTGALPVVGDRGRGPRQDPAAEDLPDWPPLTYAPARAAAVREALGRYGYRGHPAGRDPAAALQGAVDAVIDAGPGFVVVHLLAHGARGDASGGLYVVGGDGRRTRDDVEPAVIADRRPRVGIAHSLGTVVTYEALHAHPELNVDLLLTLGSPLALPHGVLHRLLPAPEGGLGRRPPGVARWVNIADHGDALAVLRPLNRYFTGVDLDLQESIGLFDFHRAATYLRSAAVAAALASYLPGR